MTATPSPAGEPVNSKFYYVPVSDDCPSCCVAGMEEQLFCNDIISGDDMLPEEVLYSSYTGKRWPFFLSKLFSFLLVH
jgi:hypothetical protein